MEIRKLLLRKEMKLVTLLLTAMLIASASATVYYSLVMQSTVTTQAADVKFVAGDDSTAAGATGYATDGTWVRFASLKAYPNASLTYEQAINISCTGSAHTIRLRHSSITDGSAVVANFYSITFRLIALNGSQYGGDFTYDNADGNNNWGAAPTMNYVSILAGEEWAVRVITRAQSGATASQAVEIVMYLDVQ